MQNAPTLDISVVVPMMNEEESVTPLYEAVTSAMSAYKRPYELIIVDDGSTDQTFPILKRLASNDEHLKVIKFRKNFGQSAAMGAGFLAAKGKVVVTMDGDLQNDPKDIPAVVEKLENEGHDIVSGWRKNRKDKLIIRKVPSKIANWIVRRTTRVTLHDTGCSLKAYRRDVVEKIRLYGEMHRFIPALGRIEGARISEIVVDHHERKFGESKYNITRTFRVIMDLTTLNLLLKYLTNPLHFFGALTCGFLGFSMLATLGFLGTLLFGNELIAEELNIQGSLIFLTLAAAANFVFFGLVGQMVVQSGEKRDERLYDVQQYS